MKSDVSPIVQQAGAQIKTEPDGAAIGIILCRRINKTVVEYTLRDSKKTVAVGEYRLFVLNHA